MTVQCRSLMEQQGIEIVPPYMIRSKEAVKERAPPIWVKKDLPPLTPSYASYMNNVSQGVGSLAGLLIKGQSHSHGAFSSLWSPFSDQIKLRYYLDNILHWNFTCPDS